MPGAMWTWKPVDTGSFAEGVKISFRPSQWNVPSTAGLPVTVSGIEKARSAVSRRTSSLNVTLIDVIVIARSLPAMLLT